MLQKITPRYQALLVLVAWGAILITTGLLRFDAFGIEEGAARALLLVWSVVDRVINPIFILGLPDLRALLFAPVGIYWPGSIIAAKVFTALITFAAALFFHNWCQNKYNKETALIGTGLLLIAPLTLTLIDTIAAGPFLLLGFGLGLWINQAYRRAERPLGGWFFLQLLLIAILTSIHPIALAYPAALIMEWRKNPIDNRQQRHIYIGIAIAIVFTLLIRGGWDDVNWLNNPITALSSIFINPQITGQASLISGIIVAILLILTLAFNRTLIQDLLGRTLILAIIIGAACADNNWALIVLTLLLYVGGGMLTLLNSKIGGSSFIGQRGLTMIILFILATVFMQGDKAQQQHLAQGLMSPHDFLIQSLTHKLDDSKDDDILVMSQWPGRTILAIRRPVLPLPPSYPDSKTLLTNIKGVTHIVFDPLNPDNLNLRDHLAKLTAISETLSLEQGGVIVRIDTTQTQKAAKDAH